MPSYPGLSEAQTSIATLAAQYLAAPTEANIAGKAALEFILQDIDRILARIDTGITEQHARMDALLKA
jgi:hypothetical protein